MSSNLANRSRHERFLGDTLLAAWTGRFTKAPTVWLALSGGVDSTLLLACLSDLSKSVSINLKCIHVNHQLMPNADIWQADCQRLCAEYGVPLVSRAVDVKKYKGQSLEAVAREARLAVFAECMNDNDILVLAHHQDDQAETFLLQLMRGAGVDGLAAMPEEKPFALGVMVRPWLGLKREDIISEAKRRQLFWIEDDSNQDVSFDRNFLRHEVIPKLKSRWPAFSETVTRSAGHCAGAAKALTAHNHNTYALVSDESDNTLLISELKALPEAKVAELIRHWIKELGFALPSHKRMRTIIEQMLYARADSMPKVTWSDVEVRRYRNKLYIMRQKPSDDVVAKEVVWDIRKPLALKQPTTVLYPQVLEQAGCSIDMLAKENVTVRYRKAGDRLRLLGQKHSVSFKDWCQTNAIPPWQRSEIPLVLVNNQIAYIHPRVYCSPLQVFLAENT